VACCYLPAFVIKWLSVAYSYSSCVCLKVLTYLIAVLETDLMDCQRSDIWRFRTPRCRCRITSRSEWRIPLSVDTRLSLALLRVDSVSVNRAPKTHKKSPVNRPAVDGRPARHGPSRRSPSCHLTLAPARHRQCLPIIFDHLTVSTINGLLRPSQLLLTHLSHRHKLQTKQYASASSPIHK